jgi:hypothetical protein
MILPKKPIFFTDAPRKYEYLLMKYDKKHLLLKKKFKLAILDLGVYTYLVKSREHQYPKSLIKGLFDFSNEMHENILVCSCDYPALDFEHNIVMNYDNVEKTLENWDLFSKSDNYNKVIFTLQFSDILNIATVKEEINLYPTKINGEPVKYIGIGSMCRFVDNSKKARKFVNELFQMVRKKYPTSWIHVWGMSIRHYDLLCYFADSFDSTKWTKPINTKILGNASCKNKEQRIQYFNLYLETMNKKFERLQQCLL